MNTYYVGKAVISNPDVWHEVGHPEVKAGDTEWQFSDGPAGERGSSYDFLSFEEGLRHLSPCIIIFEEERP